MKVVLILYPAIMEKYISLENKVILGFLRR
jgi:hypothetical protein